MHLWRIAGGLHAELGGSPASFGHGGDPVWSVALALRPDLCHPEAAREKQPVPRCSGCRSPISARSASSRRRDHVPMEVEEVAPGGVACADSRPGNAEHGARIVARLVEAGAAMLVPVEGRRMRICVYGAGAIGGHIAARLAKGGADVSVVARGPHLRHAGERAERRRQ